MPPAAPAVSVVSTLQAAMQRISTVQQYNTNIMSALKYCTTAVGTAVAQRDSSTQDRRRRQGKKVVPRTRARNDNYYCCCTRTSTPSGCCRRQQQQLQLARSLALMIMSESLATGCRAIEGRGRQRCCDSSTYIRRRQALHDASRYLSALNILYLVRAERSVKTSSCALL